ncbi:MAG TPA: ABC transporter ATP-binding protein [Candidatus Binataceae bacterium]|nr:ABC transporter ATP-binding protein [Candidatus Binataceae bacterium]
MQPIIKVRGLSKRYTITQRVDEYQTLRDSIVHAFAAPLRRLRANRNRDADGRSGASEVWALREVSFDVMPGEVMGVVGRNGAGKSTLLKILSRITEPTLGEAELYGRVGSLLEVGTGFHQELTGRENLFLSGAILGMRRAEIKRKFDEIVTFAGVEEYIDTPIKRYSSGMHVRLAFAVAAHLETEILLVDEVLAVGDAAFQKRCLGKLGDVARQGRTVLFVSHNMATIEALCDSCLYVANGRLVAQGPPRHMIEHYMGAGMDAGSGVRDLRSHPGRRRGSEALMSSVALYSVAPKPTAILRTGDPLSLCISYSSERAFRPVLTVGVKTVHGVPIFNVSDRDARQLASCAAAARATVICEIPEIPLLPGNYVADISLGDTRGDFDIIKDAISFEVVPADLFGTGRLPSPALGPVFCRANWSLKPYEAEPDGIGENEHGCAS